MRPSTPQMRSDAPQATGAPPPGCQYSPMQGGDQALPCWQLPTSRCQPRAPGMWPTRPGVTDPAGSAWQNSAHTEQKESQPPLKMAAGGSPPTQPTHLGIRDRTLPLPTPCRRFPHPPLLIHPPLIQPWASPPARWSAPAQAAPRAAPGRQAGRRERGEGRSRRVRWHGKVVWL